MGDAGYFVTFRQIDPLFSVDLSDPENPKVIGELKIPGFSEYLHPYGDGRLLGIGMAVDANVIIFARVREEMARGKSIKNALKAGFQKAMSAIIDGNVTTLIDSLGQDAPANTLPPHYMPERY